MDGGLIRVADGDVEVLRARVLEAVEILEGGEVSDRALQEWLVRAAEEPATRRMALGDLAAREARARRPRPETEPQDGAPRADEPEPLRTAQLERIADGFIAAPEGGAALADLLRVLRGHPRPRLDAAILDVVDAPVADPAIPEWVALVLRPLLERLSVPDADAIAAAIETWSFGARDEIGRPVGTWAGRGEEVRREWRAIRSRIAPAPLAGGCAPAEDGGAPGGAAGRIGGLRPPRGCSAAGASTSAPPC